MTHDETEAILHHAAPQIAPLDPDRAHRVFHNALATVPKRGTNWRGMVGIATLGTATAVVCFAFWNRAPAPRPAQIVAIRQDAPPAAKRVTPRMESI